VWKSTIGFCCTPISLVELWLIFTQYLLILSTTTDYQVYK
jgi:hypothetical protein